MIIDIEIARLRRDVDELRAELNNLAHRLNEAISNLQNQLYDKVNAENSTNKTNDLSLLNNDVPARPIR